MNSKTNSATIAAEQMFSQVQPTSVIGHIVQFPLTRFLIVLLFIAPASLTAMALDPSLEMLSSAVRSLIAVAGAVLMYLSYCLYTRLIERRRTLEMTLKGGLSEFGWGVAIGCGLMITVVALLAALGHYKIASFEFDLGYLAGSFTRMGWHALFEEIAFRLIIFKLTEEALGSWVALVVQAALFGAVHIGNPNASLFSSVAIMVEAGVLLAAVYMVTRRIWMIFGLHLAWNFMQSPIFGLSVSGHAGGGLITPSVSGPEWLTGGAFGVEAAWPAIGLCLAVGLIFLWYSVQNGRLVAPYWRRGNRAVVEEITVDK